MTGRKTVLITGCSKGGIGYELCLAFHAHGFRVFAAGRSPTRMDGLPQEIKRIEMDVTDGISIESGVKVFWVALSPLT